MHRTRRRTGAAIAALVLALLTTLLGLTGPAPAPAAAAPPLTAPLSFTSIAAATDHMCGVTASGGLYCWGEADLGHLGIEPLADQVRPTRVTTPDVTWARVDAGEGHTCALTTAGAAYCWGWGYNGALGDGVWGVDDDGDDTQETPVPVVTPPGTTWATIDAGFAHSCGVTTTGLGSCWGADSSGQLGTGPDRGDIPEPGPVVTPDGVSWTSIAAGALHSCGLTTEGEILCWGGDAHGALGNGSGGSSEIPVPIASPEGVTWATVTAGQDITCATTTAGAGYCWGYGSGGKLGNGSDADVEVPTPITTPSGIGWASLSTAVNRQHTCGLTTTGAAYCWGLDADGELGNGPDLTSVQYLPSPVAKPGVTWTTIAAGQHTSCGIGTAGRAYCWGDLQAGGGLGDGTTERRDAPVGVGRGTQIVDFAPPPNLTFGDPGHPLGATASSDLGVAYRASGPCAIVDGTKVSPTGAGRCTVTATQPGDDAYEPATPVEHSFSIGRASQTITFPQPADMTVGQAAVALGATASSGLPVGYAASGSCSIVDETKVVPTGTGQCIVSAGQPGNADYDAASAVERIFGIGQTAQTITFPVIADQTFGDPAVALGATAGSGLTVGYAASGPCTIVDGTQVAATGAGRCTVTATQPGDATHAAATPVERAFTVAKAATQTTLTADVLVAGVGDEITFSAAVAGPGTPTGPVAFTATPTTGSPRTGTGTVQGDTTARWSPHDLPAGTWSVVATYGEGTSWAASTSTALTVRVATATEEAVATAYGSVLGRGPDPAGLAFWAEQLTTRTPAAVADAIAKSREGRARLVTLTYQAVLGYTPAPADRDYWVGELMTGRVTAEGFTAFLYSTVTANPVDVLYRVHLGWAPSGADRAFWAPRVDTRTERKTASLTAGRSADGLRFLVRRATTIACGPDTAVPTGAALTAVQDLARATASDVVRVSARLAATHCPTT